MTIEQSKSILSMLAKENYISFSKPIARRIGVDESILFGELCSINYRFDNVEFFYEQEKLMYDTCLTEYRLRNALKNLQKANLVNVTKKGLPAKNYYSLNAEKLLQIMEEDKDSRSTSPIKFDTTGDAKNNITGDCEIDSTYNKKEINKNQSNKNNINKERKKVSKGVTQPRNTSYQTIIDENFTNDEVKELIWGFIEMRQMKKKPLTDRALTIQINKLKQYSSDINIQKAIIEKSIVKTWDEFYPLKDYEQFNIPKQEKQQDTLQADYIENGVKYKRINGVLCYWDIGLWRKVITQEDIEHEERLKREAEEEEERIFKETGYRF